MIQVLHEILQIVPVTICKYTEETIFICLWRIYDMD